MAKWGPGSYPDELSGLSWWQDGAPKKTAEIEWPPNALEPVPKCGETFSYIGETFVTTAVTHDYAMHGSMRIIVTGECVLPLTLSSVFKKGPSNPVQVVKNTAQVVEEWNLPADYAVDFAVDFAPATPIEYIKIKISTPASPRLHREDRDTRALDLVANLQDTLEELLAGTVPNLDPLLSIRAQAAANFILENF